MNSASVVMPNVHASLLWATSPPILGRRYFRTKSSRFLRRAVGGSRRALETRQALSRQRLFDLLRRLRPDRTRELPRAHDPGRCATALRRPDDLLHMRVLGLLADLLEQHVD